MNRRHAMMVRQCLPATCRAQIAQRCQQQMRRPITIKQVDYMLLWIRRNADELGFTILPAQRGRFLMENKYLAVSMNRDGSFNYTLHHDAFEGGMAGQAAVAKSLTKNAAIAARACIAQLRPSRYRTMLQQWVATLDFAVAQYEWLHDEAENA